ncbi:hypothetical protein C1645_767065 [Glomus cerebriforme]|uniref:Protein kinase domain-containing protein n=1 Tax=Glomus cerebriforme TaxID=658196 RepID=A0A397T628_9GLOM|nr:hypothetical protein C1645_767065 [Glomus cerebriforme]
MSEVNANSITWHQKWNIITNISVGLANIHCLESVHKVLHLGNVLKSEILCGKEYIQKSDIYSLGIIINDHYLALDICRR